MASDISLFSYSLYIHRSYLSPVCYTFFCFTLFTIFLVLVLQPIYSFLANRCLNLYPVFRFLSVSCFAPFASSIAYYLRVFITFHFLGRGPSSGPFFACVPLRFLSFCFYSPLNLLPLFPAPFSFCSSSFTMALLFCFTDLLPTQKGLRYVPTLLSRLLSFWLHHHSSLYPGRPHCSQLDFSLFCGSHSDWRSLRC